MNKAGSGTASAKRTTGELTYAAESKIQQLFNELLLPTQTDTAVAGAAIGYGSNHETHIAVLNHDFSRVFECV